MERRSFLMAMGATAPALALPPTSAQAAGAPSIQWSVFSKNIQWLTTAAYAASKPYETGVLLGNACSTMGFSSINLTVRPAGHVEPAQVRTNLPLMLAGIRSTGIRC